MEHKRVTPHLLRRTAAKQFLEGGVDRGRIARWLGYKSVGRNEVDVDAKVEQKEGTKAQKYPIEGGYDRPGQKDELLEFLETL